MTERGPAQLKWRDRWPVKSVRRRAGGCLMLLAVSLESLLPPSEVSSGITKEKLGLHFPESSSLWKDEGCSGEIWKVEKRRLFLSAGRQLAIAG